jgi:hypothetical protein
MGRARERKAEVARVKSAPAKPNNATGLVQHKLVGFPKPVLVGGQDNQ